VHFKFIFLFVDFYVKNDIGMSKLVDECSKLTFFYHILYN